VRIIFYAICIVLFSLKGPIASAQKNYSIDINAQKKRSVSIGFFIQQSKEKIKSAGKNRKRKRAEIKLSKKIRKHTYSIQTKEVKKRMKKSGKKAKRYNRGKPAICVKLKNFFRYG